MATKPYMWRTDPGAADGNTHVFADSDTGSDFFGNGTRSNPYQSLGKAWRGHKFGGVAKIPTVITCRGRFSEMMADGNHGCEINGDYYGAAVFDGAEYFVMFGFFHNKISIVNTGAPTIDLQNGLIWLNKPWYFAGVGSAINANLVGYAINVYGVAGSSVLVENTALYWGVIGGNTAVQYVCFSRPKAGSGLPLEPAKISLGGYVRSGITNIPAHNTIYGCEISNRQYKVTQIAAVMDDTLFANFAMYADEASTFTRCMFASDCNWYYTSAANGLLKIIVDKSDVSPAVNFTLDNILKTMTVGGGNVIDIPTAIDALSSGNLHFAATKKPILTDCVFTSQNSALLFNNPTKQDFTLKIGSDAIIDSATFYGAFPPCLNVPIMNDSTGVPGTWDENTADGSIFVTNDCIKFDENAAIRDGSIMSKVVAIDASVITVAGIYSMYASKFENFGYAAWADNIFGTKYTAGQMLPTGRYLVEGKVIYNANSFESGGVVVVATEGNTTFSDDPVPSTLTLLLDSNISNVVYVRTMPAMYRSIKQGDGLQRGGVYLNSGLENITYRTRTIVPKESFVAENDVDDFIHANPDYKIGVIFDDTRTPSTEWIPAQLWGEYFSVRESGVIKLDPDGVPVGSGNYLAWQTPANGGYSTSARTPIRHRYLQFKFVIQNVYAGAI